MSGKEKLVKEKLVSVPTNIITGFLGVGKSTALLGLLKRKPAEERWAVLVNEFGEVGIDGELIEGQFGEKQDVFIREVPGGCMCCANGVPVKSALNQLLSKARPDRLLIEPTGLGHPKEMLQVMASDGFSGVLSVQKVLTLVDARKLSDPRYTNHDIFNQQIAIADIVVGNKQDLYQEGDAARLEDYVKAHCLPGTDVLLTQNGVISTDSLQGPSRAVVDSHLHDHAAHIAEESDAAGAFPACGYVSAENHGEGYFSVGWRFSAAKVFRYTAVKELLRGVDAERVKAVLITDAGTAGFNLTEDGFTEYKLDECDESRIEIISREQSPDLESRLLSCLAD